MPVGAAEAGSWGGGGGTGGISTEGLGACGGPSRAGVVAVLGGGLAVLVGAESVVGIEEKGEKKQVREAKTRERREDPGFLHVLLSRIGTPDTDQTLVELASDTHTHIHRGSRRYLGRRWAGQGWARRWARPRCRCHCSLGCCCDCC